MLRSTYIFVILSLISDHIWAATQQNQQSDCAPSEDSDQPGHPPNLIRVFPVRMKKAWVLSYPLSAQRILWSDWADVQADVNLRWAHSHFVGFVMLPLISRLFLIYHNQISKCAAQNRKENVLTHICWMDFPIYIIWMSPFSILGESGVIWNSCKQTI